MAGKCTMSAVIIYITCFNCRLGRKKRKIILKKEDNPIT
jgi:hypothetical protein